MQNADTERLRRGDAAMSSPAPSRRAANKAAAAGVDASGGETRAAVTGTAAGGPKAGPGAMPGRGPRLAGLVRDCGDILAGDLRPGRTG